MYLPVGLTWNASLFFDKEVTFNKWLFTFYLNILWPKYDVAILNDNCPFVKVILYVFI